jgi:hypothetical protein
MTTSAEFIALERLVRPLSKTMKNDLARALLTVEPDQETQQRYEVLAEKNTEGALTATEKNELESLVRANSVLEILKLQAQIALTESDAK